MVDPPKVDVVVSETFGNFAFEEHIIETLADAKKRFLKPRGVIIPRGLEQFVAPVVSGRIHAEFAAWDDTGFDLSVARTMSLNNIYVRTLDSSELLEAKAWDSIVFGSDARSARKGDVSWTFNGDTTVYGFALWWTAELVPGVDLSTAPNAPRTHWEQLYFPLLEPIAAKRGDKVGVALKSRTTQEGGTHVAWTATQRDPKGRETARQTLNLDKGFLP
jgi:protein arginine N-methyltransferase 1